MPLCTRNVKTEYSNDDLPLDADYLAMMLAWRTQCPDTPEHWVFPNPSTQKPYWQETIRCTADQTGCRESGSRKRHRLAYIPPHI